MHYDQIKELADRILEECRQKGCRLHDFKTLLELLNLALAERVDRLEAELL